MAKLYCLDYLTMSNMPFDTCETQGSDTPMHGVNSFLVLRFMKIIILLYMLTMCILNFENSISIFKKLNNTIIPLPLRHKIFPLYKKPAS